MSFQFLLKAEARSLSVVQVLAMSDDEALALFRQLRWGEGEQVVCPHCGMAYRHYCRPTRKIWRCPGCQNDFTVTSGTIFAFHKLLLRLYLAAAILFTSAVKGTSALQVGRDLGVSHKTAYVISCKRFSRACWWAGRNARCRVRSCGRGARGRESPAGQQEGRPGRPPPGGASRPRQVLHPGDASGAQ